MNFHSIYCFLLLTLFACQSREAPIRTAAKEAATSSLAAALPPPFQPPAVSGGDVAAITQARDLLGQTDEQQRRIGLQQLQRIIMENEPADLAPIQEQLLYFIPWRVPQINTQALTQADENGIFKARDIVLALGLLQSIQSESGASISLRNQDFSRLGLRNVDLSGFDLRGCDFSHTEIAAAQLTNTNLEDANFSHCRSWATDFTGANVKGASFQEAQFVNPLFKDVDLTTAANTDFAKLNNVRGLSGEELARVKE